MSKVSMLNFFSAFTSEVFRPIATILIPGAIGISTWLIAVLWRFNGLEKLVSRNHAETILVLLLAMIFAGMVCEDLGGHLEHLFDLYADKCSENKHMENWYKYLRTAFHSDPIGRRYLKSLVLRLKFELDITFAMASAALGLVWMVCLGLSCAIFITSEAICFLFIVLGIYEAWQTHTLLAEVRAELLKGVRIDGLIPPELKA